MPLIGASGAIAGMVVAYLMLRPCAKVTVLRAGHSAARSRAYWVIGAFVATAIRPARPAPTSDVAYWCHVGGMLAGGAFCSLVMRPQA